MFGIRLLVCLVGLIWLGAVADLRAQMFRNRVGGSVLSQNPLGTEGGSNPVGGIGTVKFNERFIRGNRRAGDFVGRDVRDRRGFVGAQQVQTSGRVRPAAAEARVRTGPDANRAAPLPGTHSSGPYEPRLSVAFAVTPRTGQQIAEALARQLQSSPGFQPTSPIEVSVEAGTATLRGEVASARDRTLAEQLALFEPGIDAVRNELKVRPSPTSPQPYLPPVNSPKTRKSPQGSGN